MRPIRRHLSPVKLEDKMWGNIHLTVQRARSGAALNAGFHRPMHANLNLPYIHARTLLLGRQELGKFRRRLHLLLTRVARKPVIREASRVRTY